MVGQFIKNHTVLCNGVYFLSFHLQQLHEVTDNDWRVTSMWNRKIIISYVWLCKLNSNGVGNGSINKSIDLIFRLRSKVGKVEARITFYWD